MPVLMMQIGIMRMTVDKTHMGMSVNMRLPERTSGTVRMLMVLVVDMGMGMHHRLMEMFVIVAFDQMKP